MNPVLEQILEVLDAHNGSASLPTIKKRNQSVMPYHLDKLYQMQLIDITYRKERRHEAGRKIDVEVIYYVRRVI